MPRRSRLVDSFPDPAKIPTPPDADPQKPMQFRIVDSFPFPVENPGPGTLSLKAAAAKSGMSTAALRMLWGLMDWTTCASTQYTARVVMMRLNHRYSLHLAKYGVALAAIENAGTLIIEANDEIVDDKGHDPVELNNLVKRYHQLAGELRDVIARVVGVHGGMFDREPQ